MNDLTSYQKLVQFYNTRPHPNAIVEQHTYLGVKLDYRLYWCPHIDYVYNKVNKLLGLRKRNLQSCTKYFQELNYKQFTIVPVLEYHAPIWDPYHQSDINKLKWFSTELLALFLRDLGGETIRVTFINVSRSAVAITISTARLTLLYKSLKWLIVYSFNLSPSAYPITFNNFYTSTHRPSWSLQNLLFPKNSTRVKWSPCARIVQCCTFNHYLHEYIIIQLYAVHQPLNPWWALLITIIIN